MAFVIVWEFRVPPARVAEFERVYGPAGDWVRLFRQGQGYIGTELCRNIEVPGLYLTVDRWTSKADFDAHHAKHQEAYDRLDDNCRALSESERLLGRYDEVLHERPRYDPPPVASQQSGRRARTV